MTLSNTSILHFRNQMETENFARMVSLWARPGLAIALSGDLGSGKSTFARALIQALAKTSEEFDIPSPTFPIVQIYDNTRVPVAHIDLYRLSTGAEVEDLGLTEFFSSHLVIIEWPDLLRDALPEATLNLKFSGQGNERQCTISEGGTWSILFARNKAIVDFIKNSSWQDAKRNFFEGDASSRRYETLEKNDANALLMDMPQRPDGPPVKDGKPYSIIARLAEGITAVSAINSQLLDFGYSAPAIEIIDHHSGLAIIENLGGKVFGQMMRDGDDMREPLATAVEVLADMSAKSWPGVIELQNNQRHIVEAYDVNAQMIEIDLLLSWFWPYMRGGEAPQTIRHTFEEIWLKLLPKTKAQKPQWVLRDFHSPNLIWIKDRKGMGRVGLIDTQDAVMGHSAYDLASLLQDARVDIEFALADQLYLQYEKLRSKQGSFDAREFEMAYAILGAQRATKILGIFARLSKRDGKPDYLKHMPRVSRYLARNLHHPQLRALAAWFETNLPEALRIGRS